MTYYFVDYENVHSEGIVDCSELEQGDIVYVFYTEQAKNITLDVLEQFTRRGIRLELDKAGTGAKNALDFQLSSYLGYMIAKHETEQLRYVIVSKDTGFDRLVQFWGEKGIQILRQPGISVKEEAKKEKAVKESKSKGRKGKTAKDGTKENGKPEEITKEDGSKLPIKTKKAAELPAITREEVLQYLTAEEYTEEILDILNSYKTKQAINNSLSKKFRDNKKSSEIYKKLRPLMKEKKKS